MKKKKTQNLGLHFASPNSTNSKHGQLINKIKYNEGQKEYRVTQFIIFLYSGNL